MKIGYGRPVMSAFAVGMPMLLATTALAQPTSSAAVRAESGSVIEEIVVTARKREERLQDVPLAISAFDENALQKRGAVTLTALSGTIPNVRLEHVGLFQAAAAFNIRGVGSGGVESHQDPRLALYIDGAYQSRSAVGLGDMLDIEQVEILRGPQGALYGRNAFAGAISMRSRRPGEEFGGNLELSAGKYGRREMKAAVNIPLVSDTLFTRFAVMQRRFEGYYTVGNPTPSIPIETQSKMVGRDLSSVIGEPTGGERKTAYRGIITYKPTDAIETNLIIARTEARGDGSPTVNQNFAGSVFGALGFPGRQPFGDYQRSLPGDGSDPFLTGSNYGNRYDINDWDFLLDATIQVAGGEWFTVIDYKIQDSVILTDTDGELVDLFSSDRVEEYHTFQIETRYQRDFMGDRLHVLGGIFFLRDSFDLFQRLQTGLGNPGIPGLTPPLAPVPPYQFATDGRSPNNNLQRDGQRRWSWSPYLQLNYNLTPEVRLSGGLRYSYEHKRAYDYPLQRVISPAGAAGLSKDFDVLDKVVLANGCPQGQVSSRNISPSLGIDYKPTQDHLVYAQWQRAFKSAGLNVNAQTCSTFLTPYDDEQVDNYELGLKSSFWEGRAQITLAAFWSEYKGLQQSVIRVNPFNNAAAETYTSNAAGARIRGLEAEFRLRPVRALEVYGNAGLLDPKYKDFCADLDGPGPYTGTPVSECGGIAQILTPTLALIATDNSKQKMPGAPKFVGQIGARYTINLHAGDLTFDTNLNRTSLLRLTTLNDLYTDRRPMTIWDASITYADSKDRFRVVAWGRNLGNEIARQSATYVRPLFNFAHPTVPREYGVTLSIDY